jgi:allantoinase
MLGAIAKCAPPVRDKCEQENLWGELLRVAVDIVASDHSPSSPDRKSGEFWSAWGGIAGVQSTLPFLLDRAYHQRDLPLQRIASLVAAEPAQRFRIADRGRIVPGAVADLALIDLGTSFVLKPEDLLQRHPLSPYLGVSFRGIIQQTIRRGETIFADGKAAVRSGGKLVRPKAPLLS